MTSAPTPTRPARSLPAFATSFLGRERELAELADLCARPDYRLLTVVGPGGMGKTRLAVEAARACAERLADGATFVRLESVSDPAEVAMAIAEALDYQTNGQDDPAKQIGDFLHDQEMLILLDNFEQVTEAAPALSTILQAVPRVRFLVTSREVLSLEEEWQYPLSGMRLSEPGDAALEDVPAVRLFADRARRVRPDFDPAQQREHVLRVCELVEGMPLALELAASWTRYMDCAEIVSEIERNIDFLGSTLRNVPERHRQMRAVFEQSWQLLDETERSAFSRLSVFRGGFTRAAAGDVTGAAMPVLASLVDKSLVRQNVDGRYDVHEVLRQFAGLRLADDAAELRSCGAAHGDHFIRFLADRLDAMQGPGQMEATAQVIAELPNVRSAWQLALETGRLERLPEAAHVLFRAYEHSSRYLEGATFFEESIGILGALGPSDGSAEALLSLLVGQVWMLIRLGRLDEAEAVLARAVEVGESADVEYLPALGTDPEVALGVLAMTRGRFDEAAAHGAAARARAEERSDPHNLSIAFYVLENAAFARGDYAEARRSAERAHALNEQTGDRWFDAIVLSELGMIDRATGALDAARGHFEASYALRRDFDDAQGLAEALGHLGETAMLQGRLEDAERIYRESVALYRDIGDRGGHATAQCGLGRVAVARGELNVAQERFLRALDIAAEMNFTPLIFDTLGGVGELLMAAGEGAAAVELLAFVAQQPNALQSIKERIEPVLAEAIESMPAEAVARATRLAGTRDLDAVLAAVRRALERARSSSDGAVRFEAGATAGLAEELTPRELEVLQLIANGRTNPQIAQNLGISVGAAKWYTSRIYGKLGVRNRVEAAAHAREIGILP